jgi:transposase
VFVGMDSHKDTLAVSGVDATGRQQQTQVFPNPGQGHRRLLGWLQAQPGVVRVGIEGAGGYGRAVAIHLVQAGLVVVEVTPSLTVRERRRLRQRGKADPTDALAIARVTAREHDLPAVRGQDLTEDLKLLVDYREQLLGERTRIANRVHADLVALQPGYQHQLPELRSQRAAGLVRRLLADQVGVRAELVRCRLDQLDRLDAEIRALKRRIGDLVQATGTSLVQVHGVGPLVAARILGEVGDVRRFADRHKFAAANGTAPIPASSGRVQRHRLNRGGNRRLNRALYVVAITQARSDHPGRAYLARKQRQGKTRREALRCLKRRISDAIYRQLLADLQPHANPAP